MNAMEVHSDNDSKIFLEDYEVSALRRALEQVCDETHIGDFEFFARVGAEKKDAYALISKLRVALTGEKSSSTRLDMSETELEISYNALNEVNFGLKIQRFEETIGLNKVGSKNLQEKFASL